MVGTNNTSSKCRVFIDATKKSHQGSKCCFRDIPDINDKNTLLLLQTKADEIDKAVNHNTQDLLHAPPPMYRTIINDKSTISNKITMDICMETVESNIGNLDNSLNHVAHIFTKFVRETK